MHGPVWIPACQLDKVKSKKEFIVEAHRDKKKVHFATLMDICHLKNAVLKPNFQKYKGQVVFRGDIVKDDSGSNAVFTEQGSSASQMTAAKVTDVIARATRLCRTSSRRSINSHPSKNERRSKITEHSQVRMSRNLDTSSATQVAKILGESRRPRGSP